MGGRIADHDARGGSNGRQRTARGDRRRHESLCQFPASGVLGGFVPRQQRKRGQAAFGQEPPRKPLDQRGHDGDRLGYHAHQEHVQPDAIPETGRASRQETGPGGCSQQSASGGLVHAEPQASVQRPWSGIPAAAQSKAPGAFTGPQTGGTRPQSHPRCSRLTGRFSREGQRWHDCFGVGRRGWRAVRWNSGMSLGCIADFDDHLLAEDCEGGLDLLGLGGVFGIEHTADHALVESQAASQLGVADSLIAHGQVERELRRQPERHRHQALATLGG